MSQGANDWRLAAGQFLDAWSLVARWGGRNMRGEMAEPVHFSPPFGQQQAIGLQSRQSQLLAESSLAVHAVCQSDS